MIYLDNSATSYPKPQSVIEAVEFCLKNLSANPGRSGHKASLAASDALEQARLTAAELLSANRDDVFFMLNCTDALSCAIFGLLKPGDHVITTVFEHNSVLRPLEMLRKQDKITFDCALPGPDGRITAGTIDALRRKNTAMVIVNHISNVCGVKCETEEINSYCMQNGIVFCLDAAQSAGCEKLSADMADIICMPGHKGLLGPMGSGLMYIAPDVNVIPLRVGGTGSQSESLDQPVFRPDRYESGTQALPAIMGLAAGIKTVMGRVEEICRREKHLAQLLTDGLESIKGVNVLSPHKVQSGVVLFNVRDIDSRRISYLLDRDFDIATRAGYHCAPLAHKYLGTMSQGGVRASVGYANSAEDICAAVAAVEAIARSE